MKTELLIEIWLKNDDKRMPDIDISHYDLKKINKICPPESEGDFEYCNGHFVEEDEFVQLKEFIVELADYDYKNHDFDIITRRIWKENSLFGSKKGNT